VRDTGRGIERSGWQIFDRFSTSSESSSALAGAGSRLVESLGGRSPSRAAWTVEPLPFHATVAPLNEVRHPIEVG